MRQRLLVARILRSLREARYRMWIADVREYPARARHRQPEGAAAGAPGAGAGRAGGWWRAVTHTCALLDAIPVRGTCARYARSCGLSASFFSTQERFSAPGVGPLTPQQKRRYRCAALHGCAAMVLCVSSPFRLQKDNLTLDDGFQFVRQAHYMMNVVRGWAMAAFVWSENGSCLGGGRGGSCAAPQAGGLGQRTSVSSSGLPSQRAHNAHPATAKPLVWWGWANPRLWRVAL